jgi:hypothetical protein
MIVVLLINIEQLMAHVRLASQDVPHVLQLLNVHPVDYIL